WERVALLLGGAMAHYLPSLVVPPIVARLRHETQNVILPGEEEDLRRYIEERRRAGVRLNLNQLGEAILGEKEAARRLEAYLTLLARDDVEYISVKVSSVYSQIDLVAFRATVAQVAERLRTLYRAAGRHRYRHPDGRITPKFINLDMEEYRDLDLTVTAFREVLDEPEFLSLSAGIVLQAYLPDSHRVQRALTEWALARRALGGVRDARGHGQSPGAGGTREGRQAAALRARRQGRGLPQRHCVPGTPARREHRARELPAPRLRSRAGLTCIPRRARSLPGRVRHRGRALGCAPALPGSASGGGRPTRASRASCRIRERARHRLDAGGQPRVDRRSRAPVARAFTRSDSAPDRWPAPHRAEPRRRARSLAPRARRLSLCAGRPRGRRSRVDGRPGRSASVGRAVDRGTRRAVRGVCGGAWSPARRPDRRDDRRRREDGDGGRRRGLRGGRLRALLRPDAA